MPIHAGSITRMSCESILLSPSNSRGYVPASHIEYGRRAPLGNTSSLMNSTKSSPVCGLLMSTDQLIVPSGPDFGSLRANIASNTGVGSPAFSAVISPISPMRWRTTLAKIAPALVAVTVLSPNSTAYCCSPGVFANESSFIFSHAVSWQRMSIDRVLANAPKPRG